MKPINFDSLVKGQFYTACLDKISYWVVIFDRIENGSLMDLAAAHSSGSIYVDGGSLTTLHNIDSIRESTLEEKEWLMDVMKHNMMRDFPIYTEPQVNNTYSIY
jgi:hypothetical protein